MTPQERKVMELAIDLATMHHTDEGYAELRSKVRQLAKEALAQPEQEPVAWTDENVIAWCLARGVKAAEGITPPQRKPLTRGQIREIEVDVSLNPSFDYITPAEQLCRAIEAAHGIKE